MTTKDKVRVPLQSSDLRRMESDSAEFAQAEGVRDHEERAARHRRRAEHGMQTPSPKRIQHARRDRDPEHVVEKRPEEVQADVPHRKNWQDSCL